jgi:dihydroorotate dehydrogenase
VAVRAVWECRAAFPDTAIVGVGGVQSGRDAVELLQAGADAVQVGTATFRDPRAPWQVLRQLGRWCREHDTTVADLRRGRRGEAHPNANANANPSPNAGDNHDATANPSEKAQTRG